MQSLFSNFQIPVLTYHHVSDEIDYYTCVKREIFKYQMEEILKRFDCIDLQTALDMYRNNQKPKNQFVITFDDGYKDNIFALDYLSKRNIKSLVFLPTATLGKDNKWNHKATYLAPILNEEEISQLYQKGQLFRVNILEILIELFVILDHIPSCIQMNTYYQFKQQID